MSTIADWHNVDAVVFNEQIRPRFKPAVPGDGVAGWSATVAAAASP